MQLREPIGAKTPYQTLASTLHQGGHRTHLPSSTLNQALGAEGSLWVWVGQIPEGSSILRPLDGLELTSQPRRGPGVAVIDDQGQAKAALVGAAGEQRIIGWVERVWRRPRLIHLTKAPWSLLTRWQLPQKLWDHLDQVSIFRHYCRASMLQMQIAPIPEDADAVESACYNSKIASRTFDELALQGLSNTEKTLAERFLAPGDSVLDVGCGAGREAFGLAQREVRVTGIDLSRELIQRAKKHRADLGLEAWTHFAVCSVRALHEIPGSYQAVLLSSDVYAGIPGRQNRINTLLACKRAITPRGFVMVPATVSPIRPQDYLIDAPRRLLRRTWSAHIPEPGDRWSFSWPDATSPSFRHRFSSMQEILDEAGEAGLGLADRVGGYFVFAPHDQSGRAVHRIRYRRADDVVAEAFGDGLLLINKHQGSTFKLNQSGLMIWELAESGHTASEIAQALSHNPRSLAPPGHEIHRLVSKLVEGGLLEGQGVAR